MKLRPSVSSEAIWSVSKWTLFAALTAGGIWFVATKIVPGIAFSIGFKRFRRETLAREAEINRAWSETFGTPESFFARHPATATNEAARSLDQSLAKLDLLALSPSESDAFPSWDKVQAELRMSPDERLERDREADRHRPPIDPRERLREHDRIEAEKKFSGPMDDYLKAQLARESGAIDEPPPEIGRFLASHDDELTRVATLLGTDRPAWALHFARGPDSESVNLLTAVRLSRLLANAALGDLRAGRSGRALERVQAIRRLADRLAERGQLDCYLIALALDRYAAAVSRKFRALPPGATALFADHGDRNEALKDALAGEGYLAESLAESFAKIFLSAPPQHAASASGARVARGRKSEMETVWILDTKRMLVELYRLIRALDPCAAARPAARLPPEPEISRFNLIGVIVIPSLRGAVWRTDRARVEVEGAEKHFRILAALEAGRNPREIPGLDLSICRDATWRYEVSAQGGASLTMAPPLVWTDKLKGIKVPSSIRYAPPAGRAPIAR